MGTRHLQCVYVGGEYKVAKYCQWDGYPDCNGLKTLQFIRDRMDEEKFKQALGRCTFVSEKEINEMYDEIKQTRMKLLMIGLGAIFIGILGAIFLASRIVGPLKKLVEGTIRISKGDFSHKIDIHSQDEIGNLAKSFNDMSVQLLITKKRMELANRKLVQAEKLASIGRISATIAHEIRNPLTSVKLNIQKLSESNKMDKIEKGHLSISQEGIAQIEALSKKC